MTSKIYTSDIVKHGPYGIDNVRGYDAITIAGNVSIDVEPGDGIRMGQHQVLTMKGDISSAHFGISALGHTLINVAPDGTVNGFSTGIKLFGDGNTVINHGLIYSDYTSIDSHGRNTSIVNSGTLTVFFGAAISTDGASTIHNSGIVQAYDAIIASNSADSVSNTGSIDGYVHLNGGDDIFNSTGGRFSGTASGGAGNDRIWGSAAGNILHGDIGNDRLYGNAGRDDMAGGQGNDHMLGGSGRDTMDGGPGNDLLLGEADGDTLDGGKGNDRLKGGAGADTFVFADLAGDRDSILDFSHAQNDHIQLGGTHFAALVRGSLNSSTFYLGKSAHDADDHIIYDRATGHLFYDPDGAGGRAQELILTLTNHAALAASDILVL